MVQWSNCDFDCGCTQRQCPSPAREGGAWDCYQHTVPGESGMKSDESPEVSKKTCQVLTSQLWTEHRDRVSTKSDKPTCFCSEHPPKAISFKSQISSSSVSSPLKSAEKRCFFEPISFRKIHRRRFGAERPWQRAWQLLADGNLRSGILGYISLDIGYVFKCFLFLFDMMIFDHSWWIESSSIHVILNNLDFSI